MRLKDYAKLPLAWLFGHKKRHPDFDFQQVESVLIRPFGDAIGDAVIHAAYIRQLRVIYPQAKIGIFVNSRNRLIFEMVSELNEMIEDTAKSYLQQRRRWQLLLDFSFNFNSSTLILDKILSPQATVIFAKEEKSAYNLTTISNFDFHCPPPENCHTIDYLKQSVLADYFDIPTGKCELTFVENSTNHESFWQKEKIRILLSPTGSGRSILAKELKRLLDAIQPQLLPQIDLLLSYTPNVEHYLYDLTQPTTNVSVRQSSKTSLSEYLTLITSADIIIAVDSGTIHLACAAQKPLLGFYANNLRNLQRWRMLPHENIPTLAVIATKQNDSNNSTYGFDLTESQSWLNQQIQSLLAQK